VAGDSVDDTEVVDIEVDRTHHVRVVWSDGLAASFALEELRKNCPCAECRARREQGQPAWRANLLAPPLAVTQAELVGAWGISFTWSDGHATGIFAWDALRRWHDERGADEPS